MNQPTITQDNPKPFIVRVKLLSNQVFQFEVNKDIKVSDFKTLICPKVNVPVDRMRIVFAGKQLIDDKPLSQYVTESGLTVHLIARSAPPPQQPQNQPSQSQHPQPSTQVPSSSIPQPSVQPNPFGDIMGMMGSIFGGPPNGQQMGGNPQIITSFGNLGGLFGNLAPRMQQGVPSSSPPQPQPQPQMSPPQQVPQNSQSSQSNRISYAELGQLNQSINNLVIPIDNVTTQQETLTPEGVVRYLRRLHNQSTRSMLQLNRLLNMAETTNNNTSYLQSFITVLQCLNSANNVAINCLNSIREQRNQSGQSQQPQPQLQNNQGVQISPVINIVASQVDQNGNTQQIFSGSSQLNPIQISAQRVQPTSTSTSTTQHQHQPQAAQQQPQMPNPVINPIQGILGGLNLGGLLGSLDSVGGVNGLFGMNLRNMMEENGQNQRNSIFLDLFGGMTGENIMQLFVTKNTQFLRQKQPQIRQTLKKKISQSSEDEVIDQIVNEAGQIFIPNVNHTAIQNRQKCRQQCRKNLRKHIKRLVQITLGPNDSQYDSKVVDVGKKAFCQNINIIASHTDSNNTNVGFQIVKQQALATMEPILPGIAGMFYGLLQRDLFRIYNQYKAEEERRRQMTAEETQSEQQLIEMVRETGGRFSAGLSQMPHSRMYGP